MVLVHTTRSIKSWAELKEGFIYQFQYNYETGKTTASLIQISQSPNELLRDYLKHFHDAVSLMKKLNVAQAIAHLVPSLNLRTSKDLVKDIIAREPTKLNNISKLVEQHITIDEAFRALKPHDHNDRRNNRPRIKDPPITEESSKKNHTIPLPTPY